MKVEEPSQKAVIAWNGREEILILSTDLKASRKTKLLEVIPLPAQPQVDKGDSEVFDKAIKLLKSKSRKSGGKRLLGGKPPGEITLEKRIGAHHISVAHVVNEEGFVEWVAEYLRGKLGPEARPLIDDTAREVIGEYIRDGFEYFSFDIIDAGPELASYDAIRYRFPTEYLFYSLRISRLGGAGHTKIELAVLTPGLLNHYRGLSSDEIKSPYEPASVSPRELFQLNPEIAELFGEQSASLRLWEIEGPLAEFEGDLQVSDHPAPADPSGVKPDGTGVNQPDERLARIEEIKQQIADIEAFEKEGLATAEDQKYREELEAELKELLAQLDDDAPSTGGAPHVAPPIPGPPEALNPVAVSGWVVYEDSTSPTGYRGLKNAGLVWKPKGAAPQELSKTTSGKAGAYRLSLRPGDYFVDLQLPAKWEKVVDQPVKVSKGMNPQYFILKKSIQKKIAVRGTVVTRSQVDPNRFVGVPGAWVDWSYRAETGQLVRVRPVRTDGAGSFSLQLYTSSRPYTVSARSEGFYDSRPLDVMVRDGMRNVELELARAQQPQPPDPGPDDDSQPDPNVDPAPNIDDIPGCLLVVWVRDRSGNGIRGAKLSIGHSVLGGIEGQTDGSGHWSKNLVRGKATVTASAPGYMPRRQDAVMDSFSEAISFTLQRAGPVPGGPKQNVTFIVRHKREPLEDAVVSIRGESLPSTTADKVGKGQYRRELPHGRYTAEVRWQRLSKTQTFGVPVRGPVLIELP